MTTPLADLRRNYTRGTLDVTEVAADPLAQFGRWFEEAVAAQVPEPNAMTLATVAPDGRPQARVMLLKACDAEGFTFFTNYGSHKAAALAAHPQADRLVERRAGLDGVREPPPCRGGQRGEGRGIERAERTLGRGLPQRFERRCGVVRHAASLRPRAAIGKRNGCGSVSAARP